VIAGWLGAAILATLLGLAAIAVVGNGLTSAGNTTLSEADVAGQLAPAAPPPSPSPSPSSAAPSPGAPAGGTKRTKLTRGGVVTARCVGARVEIVMAPAQGFAVHEQSTGPQDSAEGEFRSDSDDKDRVKVNARCDAGIPLITERPRDNG
jgi:hypothetical protein